MNTDNKDLKKCICGRNEFCKCTDGKQCLGTDENCDCNKTEAQEGCGENCACEK